MELRLSEVLSALSHALDITEGQPRGHAERTCLIGMRLGAQVGLGEGQLSSLFYALRSKTPAAHPAPRRSPRSTATPAPR
jgi:hypothetical protein